MARLEPFRSLLEMAAVPPPAVQRAPIPEPDTSPRLSLERRLDAIALAAATPPRAFRIPALQPMVPLRLDAPSPDAAGMDGAASPSRLALEDTLTDAIELPALPDLPELPELPALAGWLDDGAATPSDAGFAARHAEARDHNDDHEIAWAHGDDVADGSDLPENVAGLDDVAATPDTAPAPPRPPRERSVVRVVPLAPAPRLLRFYDESTRPDVLLASTEPSQRWLAPVGDDDAAAGLSSSIRTTLARLRAGSTPSAEPARPLPAVAGVPELPRRGSKVLRLRGDRGDIAVCAFSSRDVEDEPDLSIDDGFDDPDLIEDRHGRSPAALALRALSDEGPAEAAASTASTGSLCPTGPGSAAPGGPAALDELAAAFGLDAGVVVPRSPQGDVAEVADADVVRVADDEDDAEHAAAAAPAAVDDADGFGDDVLTPPRGTPALSLPGPQPAATAVCAVAAPTAATSAAPTAAPIAAAVMAPAALPAIATTVHEATPAHGASRPALRAPAAVRFVVEDAPARPRHDALSPADLARNLLRARELYLVAMDDLGDGDVGSAIGHLQLAVAYDDRTALYHDLLAQLTRKLQRAS